MQCLVGYWSGSHLDLAPLKELRILTTLTAHVSRPVAAFAIVTSRKKPEYEMGYMAARSGMRVADTQTMMVSRCRHRRPPCFPSTLR